MAVVLELLKLYLRHAVVLQPIYNKPTTVDDPKIDLELCRDAVIQKQP